MKITRLLLALLAIASLNAFARVETSAEKGKHTLKNFAANGELIRLEVTLLSNENLLQTTIQDGNDRLLGTVEMAVQNRRTADGYTYLTTRNTHYDAGGNYYKTTYSIVVIDSEDKIIKILLRDTLKELLDFNVYGLQMGANYDAITSGNF
jgi:hypothetical protein